MSCVDKNNKLYYNLTKLVGDENKAKDLYARAVNPDFIKDYNIKVDKDGVPNFHDVYNKAKLNKVIDENKYIDVLNKELGSKTLLNTQEHLDVLCNEVTQFNNSGIKNYVAVIETEGNSIKSKVVRKNYHTDILSKKIKTNADLNSFLVNKLAEIGVGVGQITELERRRGIAGVTEFERAKDATNGIVELIRISNDEAGTQALPEEFAHFALEAVGEGNNLINRLYNTISEEVVETVLGDQYETYLDAYENDFNKLRKEVAGKLLSEYIKAEYTGSSVGLMERVFNAIKDKFKNLDEVELRKALIDLDATLTKVAKETLHGELLKNVEISKLSSDNKLYDLEKPPSNFDVGAFDEFDSNLINTIREEDIHTDEVIDIPDNFNVEELEEIGQINENELVDFEQNQTVGEPTVEVNEEEVDEEDFADFDESINDVDIDVLVNKNKAAENNRIKIDELRDQFIQDCENLKGDLEQEGEKDSLKQLFVNLESSITKRNKLNKLKGYKDDMTYSDKALHDYIYKHKNMLGNVLNFVFNSIQTLHDSWNYYEKIVPSNYNSKCNQLQVFQNTIKSIQYVLNNTDMQSIMSVMKMTFDKESDKKISDVIHKYVKELSYNLQVAEEYVTNERLILAKTFLKERFGETWEIPMTLADSQTITLDDVLANGKQEDVGTLTRLFSSLANTPDMLLKMVDQIVKGSNDNRRNKVLKERNMIIALGKKYVEETGSSDFTWFYETMESGERSGYYISDMNMGEYDKYYKEIVLDTKSQWLKDGEIDKDAFNKVMRKFNKVSEQHNGFKNNKWDSLTQAQKDFANKFREYKESLDRKMFSEAENEVEEDEFTEMEKELEQLEKDPFGFKIQREEFLKRKRSLKTVKIAKSLINKLKSSKTMKEAIQQIGREFKEMFIKTSQDVEMNDEEKDKSYLTDFEGKRVYDIPRLFTQIKDTETEENISMDPISTLIAYADASENRYEKLKITGLIDIITQVVNNRKLADTSTGKKIFAKLRTNMGDFKLPMVTNGDQSNISKMLQDYLESQIYGMWNSELGNIGKTNISKDKLINSALSQTALTGMALNVLGGISNVDTGRAMMRIESICGEFFNVKDVAKADVTYAKEIGKVIADAGNLVKTSKMGVFIEQFNVLQEYEQSILHTEFDANRFARCCSEQGLFILNNLGEHFLQTRTALSVAMATKLKDKNGKEITLWDAMELQDYDKDHPEFGKKIVLKEGVTKSDGSEIGNVEQYFNKYLHKVQAINQRMHGIYNYEDRCAAQRYAVGRMFYQFRKYIPSSINRMFGKAQMNLDLDAPTEGYYRTFGKMLLKVYKEAKTQRCSIFNTGVWKNMKPWERQNCVRSIVSLAQTLLVFGAVQIIEAMAGDKPKQSPWAIKMMNYKYRRLYSELAAFTPSLGMVNEALKIVESPFAACRILDKNIEFLEMFNPWNWAEGATIHQGKYAGHTKGAKAILQCLPVYSSMVNTFDPYEATKFFKQ